VSLKEVKKPKLYEYKLYTSKFMLLNKY